MRKHIFGFALFSFIITAAICIGIATTYKKIDYFTKSFPAPPAISQTEAQSGEVDARSPTVSQAVLNMKTKRLDVELFYDGNSKFQKSVPPLLKFFRKDANGTKFLGSVKLDAPNFGYREFFKNTPKTKQISGVYNLLDNLDAYDNLYVLAILDAATLDGTSPDAPVFDSRRAKAVTLAW